MTSLFKSTASKLLQVLGRSVPNLPRASAVGNRILWPMHKAFGLDGGITAVLGVRMKLDPNECVDRNLWFSPQLYDAEEIRFALQVMEGDQCRHAFIDAGSNIGFWSLMVAVRFPLARVISIEANPRTAKILEENIALNSLKNIEVVQMGLGKVAGEQLLYCGNNGNRGGDSLVSRSGNESPVPIAVMPMTALCERLGIETVSFLKMDIEGMEEDVLQSFFRDSPIDLHPGFICLEHTHCKSIEALMKENDYRLIRTFRDNSIYRRSRPMPEKPPIDSRH